MKSMTFTLVATLAVQSLMAAPANTFAASHILESSIYSLAKASNDLAVDGAKYGAETHLGKEVLLVRRQVSSLIKRTSLVPMAPVTEQIKNLGFEFSIKPGPVPSTTLVTNTNISETNRETYALKSERYQQISALVDEHVSQVRSIAALVSHPSVAGALMREETQQIDREAGPSRLDALSELKRKAQKAISCIEKVSASYDISGLQPVGVGEDDLRWSTERLQSKYGVFSFEKIPSSKKEEIKAHLERFIKVALSHDMICVPKEHVFFADEQLRKIRD